MVSWHQILSDENIINHTTIMRWVHQYGSEIEKKMRKHRKTTNDSWRVDKTYIKVKGKWMYLYRAVDSNGDTVDFILCVKRGAKTAKYFFIKALRYTHNKKPKVVTNDKNATFPKAIKELKNNIDLNINTEFR